MNVKDSVNAAFRAHRCCCKLPSLGPGHPCISTGKGCCQHRSIIAKSPGRCREPSSVPCCWDSLYLEPCPWLLCLLLAQLVKAWHAWLHCFIPGVPCTELWTLCLAMLCLVPMDLTSCSVLPVSGGPKLTSFWYSWCTGQQMVFSVLIIMWNSFIQ